MKECRSCGTGPATGRPSPAPAGLFLSTQRDSRRDFFSGVLAARSCEKLAPQASGVLAEQQIHARRQHIPSVSRELVLELERRPARESGVEAKALSRARQQAFDGLGLHRQVDASHDLKRRRLGLLARLEQRNDGLAPNRTAEKHALT